MEALQETTVWANPNSSNHIYLLDGMNLVAYIKFGETNPFFFKNPIKGFDKKGRKFIKADLNLFGAKPKSNIVEVNGSTGVYLVDPEAKTCTCPGFSFRRTCKHIVAIK